MTTRIRHVNPIQYAIVLAVLYALLGIVYAIFFMPFMALMSSVMPTTGGRAFGGGMSVAVIVMFPIMFGISGFIFGLIGSALYNLVAGWTGGIELTFSGSPEVSTAPGSTVMTT